MKCIIIYFSQTGNTELIAKTIQKGVKQAAGHCDIVTLKEANWRRLYEYDLIGLGTPIMHLTEPVNVRAFINNMRFVGGKHIFVFATHGTLPDYFFTSIVPKLKRRGLIVIGMYNCYAPCYMPQMPEPYPTAGHPDEIDLKEAEDFGREVVERSRRIAAGETGLIPPLPKWANPNLAEFHKETKKQVERMIEQGVPPLQAKRLSTMKLDKEKCTYPECRLCMDNCPMDGIDLSMNPPVVGKPCISCKFCEQICPTGAITDEGAILVENFPGGKMGEGHHMADLVKAEAEGRFRRLVPAEDIDWNTPIYLKHTKHPRWIIGKGLQ